MIFLTLNRLNSQTQCHQIYTQPIGWCLVYMKQCRNCFLHVVFRDHFYQFGEIRSITVASKQQCAFVHFMNRVSAELAAEKSFNKLILKGRRLNVKWGKSQAQQLASATASEAESGGKSLDPVPGLPGGRTSVEF